MGDKNIFRWGGFVSILAGILWVNGTLLLYLATQYDIGTALLGQVLRFSSSLFFVLTITALYSSQFRQSGKMGFVSFVLAVLGVSLNVIPEYLLLSALAGSSSAVLEMNNASPVALITTYTYLIGTAWFGIATFFASVLPKWGALFFAVGVILSAMPNLNEVFPLILFPIGAFLGGSGLIWMGWALLKSRPALGPG